MKNPTINRFPNILEMSTFAAEYICNTAQKCVRKRGIFSLVLSGGSTPIRLFEILASDTYSKRMPWDKTHIFWADERCVPPDHPDSNFNSAWETLLSKVPLLTQNIHRIQGEMDAPEKAAIKYELDVRHFFSVSDTDYGLFSKFDLLLLGMGNDGHTASLFPGSDILNEDKRLVAAVRAPDGVIPSLRITLTLPAINHAERILFLVSESGKQKIIHSVFHGGIESAPLPVSRVKAVNETVWLIAED